MKKWNITVFRCGIYICKNLCKKKLKKKNNIYVREIERFNWRRNYSTAYICKSI